MVAMRRAMSAPNNDHVKLHPANLVALQKANYLFHCAHNCFLVPVVVVVDDFSFKKKVLWFLLVLVVVPVFF